MDEDLVYLLAPIGTLGNHFVVTLEKSLFVFVINLLIRCKFIVILSCFLQSKVISTANIFMLFLVN